MSKEAEEYRKKKFPNSINIKLTNETFDEVLTDFHKSQLEKITEEDIKQIGKNAPFNDIHSKLNYEAGATALLNKLKGKESKSTRIKSGIYFNGNELK